MSRDASCFLMFPNGEEYTFRLAWGQMIKIQEARGCGPLVVYNRLWDDSYFLEDVREVIHWGLVGGGMNEIKANKLCREYVEGRPILDNIMLARTILKVGLMGPPDEEEIEKKTPETIPSESTISATGESASPNSTELVH